jgi:hypothetical protein
VHYSPWQNTIFRSDDLPGTVEEYDIEALSHAERMYGGAARKDDDIHRVASRRRPEANQASPKKFREPYPQVHRLAVEPEPAARSR